MADDEFNQDLPDGQQAVDTPEDLPEKLRVHSLARLLGTTSKRVLEVLAQLDGRTGSPQSSVDQADAGRVRDALAAADTVGVTETADATGATAAEEPPAYMPLFVAPQPVTAPERGAADASDEDPADDTDDDSDSEAIYIDSGLTSI